MNNTNSVVKFICIIFSWGGGACNGKVPQACIGLKAALLVHVCLPTGP